METVNTVMIDGNEAILEPGGYWIEYIDGTRKFVLTKMSFVVRPRIEPDWPEDTWNRVDDHIPHVPLLWADTEANNRAKLLVLTDTERAALLKNILDAHKGLRDLEASVPDGVINCETWETPFMSAINALNEARGVLREAELS